MTAEDGALHALAAQTRQTLATVDAVLGGANVSRTAQDVRDALRSFTRAMNQLNSVVEGSSADVRAISASMRDTAEHLEEFAQTIREDPSLIIRPTREQ
jgi:methyl-accepting chemotaxis protein